MKKLLHRWRFLISSTFTHVGLVPTEGKYQVIYPDDPPFNRTVRMPYHLADNYARMGEGDIVRFGEDEVLWSYRNRGIKLSDHLDVVSNIVIKPGCKRNIKGYTVTNKGTGDVHVK